MIRIVVAGAVLAALAGSSAVAASVAETDFRNFTYPFGLGDGVEKVTVTDGEFTRDDPNDRLFFKVRKVLRGDIGSDGTSDALVLTEANGGGSGFFTDGYVFVDGQGGPKIAATLGIGDRADGGIYDARIVGGRIVEERFHEIDSGACCPTEIRTTTLALGPKGLRRVGRTTRRAYVYSGNGTRSAPARLRFLPGTVRGTVQGDGYRNERVVFGAARGQRATLSVHPMALGLYGRLVLTQARRRLAFVASGGRATVTLPVSGTYTLRFDTTGGNRDVDDGTLTVDVTIR